MEKDARKRRDKFQIPLPEFYTRPDARYDATHTTQIKLKLNLTTDADILERLNEVGNKQGYIKQLIRDDIAKNPAEKSEAVTCPAGKRSENETFFPD